MLILKNDPDFAGFAYNELANRVQVTGSVPWERPSFNSYWRDADTAQMKALLDVKYVCFSARNHDVCFTKTADDRRFHPVRDYLDGLPEWDGTGRIERLLVRCLEAEDTPYVRAVTRKTLAAAVARIYRPGTKFDSVLVLDGVQGIGKSTLFKELAGDEYYSETLSLTDMDDKSGAEKLQGFWVVEIGELAGMKKADIEKVKAFLSTSDDKYRPSYGRTVESHPRGCIIIGSVNGERGYLRDVTGNRRFWVVKVRQEEQVKRWDFSPGERDQIWAEAKAVWQGGEKLYLEGELIGAARLPRRTLWRLTSGKAWWRCTLTPCCPRTGRRGTYMNAETFSAMPCRPEGRSGAMWSPTPKSGTSASARTSPN
jgi:predicted P-loop ATPase